MRTSGPATLEVEMPSGYVLVQSDANELVIKNNYTFIRDVFIGRSKIIWMFDRVIQTAPFFLLHIFIQQLLTFIYRWARSVYVSNILSIVGSL